jgi:hypothetical protein
MDSLADKILTDILSISWSVLNMNQKSKGANAHATGITKHFTVLIKCSKEET